MSRTERFSRVLWRSEPPGQLWVSSSADIPRYQPTSPRRLVKPASTIAASANQGTGNRVHMGQIGRPGCPCGPDLSLFLLMRTDLFGPVQGQICLEWPVLPDRSGNPGRHEERAKPTYCTYFSTGAFARLRISSHTVSPAPPLTLDCRCGSRRSY